MAIEKRLIIKAFDHSEPELCEQTLAIMAVVYDSAEIQDAVIQRRVKGSLVEFAGAWERFLEIWRANNALGVVPVGTLVEGGRKYIPVRGLQVDCDVYGNFSWLWVDGDEIEIILVEQFEGEVGDYYEELAARNQKVRDRLAKWDSGDVSRNEIRAMQGYPPIEAPLMDEPMGKEGLKQLKHLLIEGPAGIRFRTNLIS